jgi:hypothetical protein
VQRVLVREAADARGLDAVSLAQSVFKKLVLIHTLDYPRGYGTPKTISDRPQQQRMGADQASGAQSQTRGSARAILQA